FNPERYYKVINTGTIGPLTPKWGQKKKPYLNDKYDNPVVLKKISHKTFPHSYRTKAPAPKIIIKSLTLLVASLDYEGEVIPGKSTLIVRCEDVQKLLILLAILNSKLAIFYIKERYSASSYNTGINFTKDMITNLPVPHGNFQVVSKLSAIVLECG